MSDTVSVRLTEEGPLRIRGSFGVWERGGIREVSPEHAEALLDSADYYEIVDVPTESDEPADGDDSDDAGGAVTTDDVVPDDEFDADAWLDQPYGERADRVRAGDVDDHLGEIEDAETSENVLDAIGERRAELEA